MTTAEAAATDNSAAVVNVPLWSATAPPAGSYPELSGNKEADVVVIGAGFTGLSTALALAGRGRKVMVIEAGEPGGGASGRSGGQVIPGLRHFMKDLDAAYGRQAAQRAHDFGSTAADACFDLIAANRIACEAVRSGKIQVADTPAGLADAKARAEAWQKRGAPVRFLERDELVAATGTRAYLGGWIDMRGGSVQPLALIRGLAKASRAAGVTIHAHSCVRSVARSGAAWRIATAGGSVTARQLLLATNATTDALWPGLCQTFLRVWSYQIATTPLSSELRTHILPKGQSVSDTRRVLRYFRTDAAGRLIVGGKGRARTPTSVADFDFQRQTLGRLYPELADYPLDYAWGGEVCITADRLPRIIRLGPDAYAHLGCNGKGVAWCTAIGAAFAEMFTSGDERALPIPVTPLKRIPFHWLRHVYVGIGGVWLRLRDSLDATAVPTLKESK